MIKKFNDIANITTGVITSRLNNSQVESYNLSNGLGKSFKTYKYFTLSSISATNIFDPGRLENIDINNISSAVDKSRFRELSTTYNIDIDFFSRVGDILIGLLQPHSIFYIDNNTKDYLIPSQFGIVRVLDDDIISPEYLYVYLQSEGIQSQIKNNSKGVSVRTIDLKKIRDLEINIVDLEHQKRIVEYFRLAKEEYELNKIYTNLLEQKNNYYINKMLNM